MKRKKFSEIESKEDRQEFLQYLMEKELEIIRKKTCKYKRCNAICYPIAIEETIFEDNAIAGRYVWDKENKIHKIYIASKLLNNYISEYYCTYVPKAFDKRMLKNTIGHEITHALVKEKFEHIFSNIRDKNCDGSPIFLATLQYLGYSSGHYCGYNYNGSKVWKDINELKKNNASWDDFKDYIFFYLVELDGIRETFNKEYQSFQLYNKYQFIKQSINFEFSSRGSGLHKGIQSTAKYVTYIKNKKELKKLDIKDTTFEIGSMMYPKLIKKLLIKKLNNNIKADISLINYEKIIIDDETKHNKWLYKKEELYNKYEERKTA